MKHDKIKKTMMVFVVLIILMTPIAAAEAQNPESFVDKIKDFFKIDTAGNSAITGEVVGVTGMAAAKNGITVSRDGKTYIVGEGSLPKAVLDTIVKTKTENQKIQFNSADFSGTYSNDVFTFKLTNQKLAAAYGFKKGETQMLVKHLGEGNYQYDNGDNYLVYNSKGGFVGETLEPIVAPSAPASRGSISVTFSNGQTTTLNQETIDMLDQLDGLEGLKKVETVTEGTYVKSGGDELKKFKDAWSYDPKTNTLSKGDQRIVLIESGAMMTTVKGDVVQSIQYVNTKGEGVSLKEPNIIKELGITPENIEKSLSIIGSLKSQPREDGIIYEGTNTKGQKILIQVDRDGVVTGKVTVPAELRDAKIDFATVSLVPGNIGGPNGKPVFSVNGVYVQEDGTVVPPDQLKIIDPKQTTTTKGATGVEYDSLNLGGEYGRVPFEVLKKQGILNGNNLDLSGITSIKVDASTGNTWIITNEGVTVSEPVKGEVLYSGNDPTVGATIRRNIDAIDFSKAPTTANGVVTFSLVSGQPGGASQLSIDPTTRVVTHKTLAGQIIKTEKPIADGGSIVMQVNPQSGSKTYSFILKGATTGTPIPEYIADQATAQTSITVSGNKVTARFPNGRTVESTPLTDGNGFKIIDDYDSAMLNNVDLRFVGSDGTDLGSAEGINPELAKNIELPPGYKLVSGTKDSVTMKGETNYIKEDIDSTGLITISEGSDELFLKVTGYSKGDRKVTLIEGVWFFQYKEAAAIVPGDLGQAILESGARLKVDDKGKAVFENGWNVWIDDKGGTNGLSNGIGTVVIFGEKGEVKTNIEGLTKDNLDLLKAIEGSSIKEGFIGKVEKEVLKILDESRQLVKASQREEFNGEPIISVGSDFYRIGNENTPQIKKWVTTDKDGNAIGTTTQRLEYDDGDNLDGIVVETVTVFSKVAITRDNVLVYPDDSQLHETTGRKATGNSEYQNSDGWTIAVVVNGITREWDSSAPGGFRIYKGGKEIAPEQPDYEDALKETEEKWKKATSAERLGMSIDAAYKAALGVQALGRLFGLSWTQRTGVFAALHNFFTQNMFGALLVGNWEDSICSIHIQKARKEGALLVETPSGLSEVGAHIEGQRVHLVHPIPCSSDPECSSITGSTCKDRSCVNEYEEVIMKTDYIYKITYGITNPEDPYDPNPPVSFNIYLTKGSEKVWFYVDEANGVRRDINLEEGESNKKAGAEAFVKQSETYYEQVCMILEGDGAWTFGLSPGGSLCRNFVEISDDSHPLPEDYQTGAQSGAVATGSGNTVVNSNI